MPIIPGPVDDQGNITVPSVGGTVIPIRESNPADDSPINISATPMRFVVKGRIDKVVPADPNYAQGKLLVLTDDDADELRAEWTSFNLLDETDPLVPIPIWSGKIRRAL
jgi:hypothetical protein